MSHQPDPTNVNQGDAAANKKQENTDSGLVWGSFVYPVRSLLSGIQSSQQPHRNIDPEVHDRPEELPSKVVDDCQEEEIAGGVTHKGGNKNPVGTKTTMHNPSPTHRKSKRSNFRDFHSEDNPLMPRTFSTNHPSSSMSPDENREGANTLFAEGPIGEPVEYRAEDLTDIDDEDESYNPRHPPQMSEVAAEAFTSLTEDPVLAAPTPKQPATGEHSFLSQSGIVHLGPVERSPSRLSRSSNSSSQPQTRSNSERQSNIPSPLPPAPQLGELDVVQLPSTRPDPVKPRAGSGAESGTDSSASPEEPHITFRYQHIESEDGHHLIVGREGKLTKCEDEPIRTPGAVQGFGVLIAVEEDEETGNLVVRQVSENSTELLGLSPSHLFSLECFTQTLPDTQADLLLDNIQYLSDTALTAEEQAENLHVFMLSGFGESGTALQEEATGDPLRRRSWSCWCAAHRPQMTAPANFDSASAPFTVNPSLEQNLIILEFELERDPFNPLYPVTRDSNFQSNISSPSDASGSASTDASNSNSSGATLVSTASEASRELTPEGSTPSIVDNPSTNVGSSTALSSGTSSGGRSSGSPSAHEVPGSEMWLPSPEAILESTTSLAKPLLALERLRRNRRAATDSPASPASPSTSSFNASGFDRGAGAARRGGVAARRRRGAGAVGMMDVFSVMSQINEQLGAATDMDTFLKIVVGIIKDLTQFHRVLVYQFDEQYNGKVVAELVDWNQTHDLYNGLHFPASDIPPQARHLYALNKVRLLYDRGQPTARLVVKSRKDLKTPLDMTHCYLRAMSPIHIKYLGNMGVRASMSVSIMGFGQLWGLVACHSYGPHGMRVSFPVRQMLRLLSQSISRNVERLSYAQRLHTRKLVSAKILHRGRVLFAGIDGLQINTMPTNQHPSGYIVSDADDLLGLFDADYGVLVIGEGAKILGPNQHGQEILVVAEYLRLKQFNTIQVSQAVNVDYPDLQLSTGLEVIAGLLYVPLSVGGGDFIAFMRKGQPRQVNWAGRPYKEEGVNSRLEPRASFRIWSETVSGRCRAWTEEQLETAGVLALVYGKFIEVWRQKESVLQTTKLTNILLSNASHEVRTPLNHIINYLEMALNGHLDTETRENLSQSHAASKSLLFTINDLLDLTRLESGNETSFNEPFDLHSIIREATIVYKNEAARRGLKFHLDVSQCPRTVIGDPNKIRTVVANLTANAFKYTEKGTISVECHSFEEPAGLHDSGGVAVEIVVSDTGCGIPVDKLESIFREFEQVEATSTKPHSQGLGLGLAVVARIVEQLGGQLRVDSKVNLGSRFSFLIPFNTETDRSSSSSRTSRKSSRDRGIGIESVVQAIAAHHLSGRKLERTSSHESSSKTGSSGAKSYTKLDVPKPLSRKTSHPKLPHRHSDPVVPSQLRILIVEDNDINRTILAKRLTLDGHVVVNTTNGQEGLDMVEIDGDFDCVLMDIQMPLLNGYEATERIRALELDRKVLRDRLSHKLNGRLPIFAVSASLLEAQRDEMYSLGIDGWILKPIDFKRLRVILKGVIDTSQREKDVYKSGCSWEAGGWLTSTFASSKIDGQ